MGEPLEILFVRFRDQGDAAALAEVFDRTAPALLKVAMHLVPDGATAEDLLQATFVTAMERERRYRAGRPLMPWLIGILLKKAKNSARKSRPVPGLSGQDPDASPGPLARAAEAETREALAAALADLPAPYREVLIARLEQGKGGREIALELDRAPGTVRMQIHRGLSMLRKMLPRGLCVALGLLAVEGRGLAAVRRAVLARGAELCALGAAAKGAIAIGGLVMSKKLVSLAVLALLLGSGAVWTGLVRGPGRERNPSPSTGPVLGPAADPSPTAQEAEPLRTPAARGLAVGLLQPVPDERPAGDTVLTGRVLSAERRLPIPGAWVAVRPHRWWDSFQWTATTGEDGRFRFERIDLMDYPDLWVRADGFAEKVISCTQETRRSEEKREEFTAGDILLDQGECIEGMVLDDAGAVVEGASILLVSTDTSNLFRPALGAPEGRSDEQGRFVLPHVPSQQSSRAMDCWVFAVADSGVGAKKLRIVRGMQLLRDVVVRLAPSCRVKVRVTREDGAPVAGATVAAEPRFEPLFGVKWQSDGQGRWQGPQPDHNLYFGEHEPLLRLFRAVSGEDGVAELAHLPAPPSRLDQPEAGPYDLVIRAEGCEPAFLDDQRFLPGSTSVCLVSLRPLRPRSIAGVLLAADGRPAPQCTVHLQRRLRARSESYPTAQTDKDGTFRFDGLSPEGSYEVWTSQFGRDDFASASVEWSDDQDTAEVLLRISSEPMHPISGRLIDQFGAPVPFVFLQVTTGDSGDRDSYWPTDAEGFFTIPSPIAGAQALTADLWPPSAWADTAPRWTVHGDTSDLVLVVERRPAGLHSVIVDVVDAVDDSPLVPLSASAFPVPRVEGRGTSARTSVALGRVEVDQLEPGDWRLVVDVAKRGEHELRFTVAAGDLSLWRRLEIPRTGEVLGRLVFRGPAPPNPVPLEVRPKERRHGLPLQLDGTPFPEAPGVASVSSDGRFRIGELVPGPVTLCVSRDYVKGEVDVTVLPGRVVEVELPCSFCGRLVTDGFRTLPAGSGALFLAGADGVFHFDSRIDRCEADGSEMRTLVLPGEGRWRFAFIEGQTERPPEEWPVLAEGSYAVRAGEQVSLPVGRGP